MAQTRAQREEARLRKEEQKTHAAALKTALQIHTQARTEAEAAEARARLGAQLVRACSAWWNRKQAAVRAARAEADRRGDKTHETTGATLRSERRAAAEAEKKAVEAEKKVHWQEATVEKEKAAEAAEEQPVVTSALQPYQAALQKVASPEEDVPAKVIGMVSQLLCVAGREGIGRAHV